MRGKAVRMLAAMAVSLVVVGCMGGDEGDRKRAEAAEWCDTTAAIEGVLDDRDGMRAQASQIDFDQAAEWVDVAPADIRGSTERAARILREASFRPRSTELADSRREIAEYTAEYCPAPVDCIADVERNPRFPCIHG
jgi:hypothetical protein